MKKKIITAAIAFAAICGLSASAQRPQCNKTETCTTEAAACNKATKTCRDTVSCCGPYSEIFAGLNLTADQQKALKDLKPQRDRKSATCESGKATCDKSAREGRQQKRRDYISKVKQILTPEQYVTFLEEVVVTSPARMEKAQRHHGARMRHDKKDFKAERRANQDVAKTRK